MQIIISGRGVNLTDAIETYVTKKINGLDKFFSGIIRADVVMGKETRHCVKGDIFTAECKLEVPGNDVFERQTAKDIYAAIDALRDRLEGELKKRKAKLRQRGKAERVSRRANKEYVG